MRGDWREDKYKGKGLVGERALGLRHFQGMKPLLYALNEASRNLGPPITP